MSQTRVFIPEHNARYDPQKAAAYGELIYLMEDQQNPFADSLLSKYVIALEQVNFDPQRDLICLTGQALICALLLATAIRIHGEVRVLMFDARVSYYRLKVLSLEVPTT